MTGQMRAPDVFVAARYLKTLPQIDGKRIAAIGYSHGGWTLMWAVATEAQYPDVDIRAFIMFYPTCTGWKTLSGTTPVLLLLGGKDDWTPAAPCETLAQSASRAGRNVTAVLYPDAYHHFDGAEVRGRRIVPDARGGLGATIEYNPKAHEDAEKQVRVFLDALPLPLSVPARMVNAPALPLAAPMARLVIPLVVAPPAITKLGVPAPLIVSVPLDWV